MRIVNEVRIGGVKIGGNNPIAIQALCTTKTDDIKATVAQIHALEKEGCDIIRVAIPDSAAARAIPRIKEQISSPLVADIHYDYRLALDAITYGADKVRINPGNIGALDRVEKIVEAAMRAEIPIRIGVNAGSLEKEILAKYGRPSAEALVASALKWVRILEGMGFFNLVVSLKSADVQTSILAQKNVAGQIPYPIHIGVTEAGTLIGGIVKTAIGISTLLQHRIGSTFRVSITEDPVLQVRVAREILRTLGLRSGGFEIISCPSCGRADVDIHPIAIEVERRARELDLQCKIAVMACSVNAAGEAREADYGIGCGKGRGAIFRKGIVIQTVVADRLIEELFAIILRDQSDISSHLDVSQNLSVVAVA